MNKTIGVLAHVDAGKTTFSEQILYHTKSIRNRGRVDHKNAHLKHTSGGDFREATLRALRQGLEKADCMLLEPYYRFKIEVEQGNMGRVLSDVQKLQGTFEAPITIGGKVIINGRGPVANFMNYSTELVSFTKGKGSISLFFDGYDICHNEAAVIENSDYNKDADTQYTSNSIFCAKGAGYPVVGSEAEEYMHCL